MESALPLLGTKQEHNGWLDVITAACFDLTHTHTHAGKHASIQQLDNTIDQQCMKAFINP